MDKKSPLEKAGVKPMVDFILYEPTFDKDPGIYQQTLMSLGKLMEVQVYNLISQMTRSVKVTPNLKWGGSSLLGADIRFEDYSIAHRTVYYVSDVQRGSPAEKAGLKA